MIHWYGQKIVLKSADHFGYFSLILGFNINRSMSEILEICKQNLHEPENRKKGEYPMGKGVP